MKTTVILLCAAAVLFPGHGVYGETITIDNPNGAIELNSLGSIDIPGTISGFTALAEQIPALDAQLGALTAQLDVHTTRKPADRAAWEAYRKAYDLVLSEKWKEAAVALEDVEKKFGKSEWADDAAFWRALSVEKSTGAVEETYKTWENFLSRYPGSRWVQTAKGNMIGIANQLTRTGKSEYTEKIRQIGDTDNLSVSLSALMALRTMGEDLAPELESLYRYARDDAAKERILNALQTDRSENAAAFLIRIAETDTSDTVRRKAVDYLGSRIISLNTVSTIRFSSTNGLAGVVFPPTAPTSPMHVIHTPNNFEPSPEEKAVIIAALGRIARNDPDEDIRGQALFWVGRSGSDAELLKLLESAAKSDPSMEVRQKALMALSQMPENKGVPGLIGVAKSDAGVSLRRLAIAYLGMSKDPRAKEALREIVREGK